MKQRYLPADWDTLVRDPIVEDQISEGPLVSNEKLGSEAGKTVLIVDDDPSIRLVLTKSLPTLGYTVVAAAETGEEAIQLALQSRPQIILMDARIPAPDGLEASRAINEHHPTPIVLMTAYSDAETIERAKEAGIMAFMRKPFDIEELQPTIENSPQAV